MQYNTPYKLAYNLVCGLKDVVCISIKWFVFMCSLPLLGAGLPSMDGSEGVGEAGE